VNIKLTKTSVILLIINLVLVIVCVNLYSNTNELKNNIKTLEKELEQEREISKIYSLTDEFIHSSSTASHEDLLTGAAKERFEEAKKERGDHEGHTHQQVLDHVEIIHISAVKTSSTTAKSHAIYKLFYNYNPETDDIATQRILYITLIAEWEKTKNGFKVNDYKINLLKDSIDEYLKELSKDSN